MAGIIFGCIILVLVGWAIVKGKYAPFILIASGVAMLAFSVFFDTGTFMPKKVRILICVNGGLKHVNTPILNYVNGAQI